jgi:poly(3-hydroxybutyrate) depolymerase
MMMAISMKSKGRFAEVIVAVGRWTVSIIAGLLAFAPAAGAQPLPRLQADAEPLTVSGLSSGGYMAVQLAVAHSKRFRGVGVFAGGPYYCVGLNPMRAETVCMKGAPLGADSVREARRLAAIGLIDAPENLKAMRAWLLAGSADATVVAPVVEAARDFFAEFNSAGVQYRLDTGLGHGLPTVGHGVACSATAAPFLNNCGQPAAAQMLAALMPGVPGRSGPTGTLERFDQGEFIPFWRRLWALASLDSGGYVYIPPQCRQQVRCRVHVALHGCRQGVAVVGDEFVRKAGYNEWADQHDTIVLYPQAKPSEPSMMAWWLPFNPRGCWDWWGYTGTDYAVKSGVQITAIIAMVDRLAAKR